MNSFFEKKNCLKENRKFGDKEKINEIVGNKFHKMGKEKQTKVFGFLYVVFYPSQSTLYDIVIFG